MSKLLVLIQVLATGGMGAESGATPQAIKSPPAITDAASEKDCKVKNFYYVTGPDGQRHIAPALADAAEYVWRNEKCELIGGLVTRGTR